MFGKVKCDNVRFWGLYDLFSMLLFLVVRDLMVFLYFIIWNIILMVFLYIVDDFWGNIFFEKVKNGGNFV